MRRAMLYALRYVADAAAYLSAFAYLYFSKSDPRTAIVCLILCPLCAVVGHKLYNIIDPEL